MATTARITVAIDSGALIALSKGDEKTRAFLRQWVTHGASFILPAPVLAETLRGGPKDAPVHHVINTSGVEISALSPFAARHAGELLGKAKINASHTLDALITAIAMEQKATDILTCDPDDMRLLSNNALHIIAI